MRILVIGDSMLDSYLWGNVERVSPEAPIPVVCVTDRETRLGGAANVSLNIQALGGEPVLFSVVGEDENGRRLKRLMEEKKMSSRGILEDGGRVTTVKSRIIGKGQHIARVDEEMDEQVSAQMENALLSGIRKEVESQNVNAIVFVDYDKGVITPSLFQKVNAWGRERGIPTAVDPKRRNFHLYRNVSLFKPNIKEFADGMGFPLRAGDLRTLREKALELKTNHNFGLIFITLSEMGVFISNGSEEQHFPAVIRQIADVSGAGDTVMSVAGLALAAGVKPRVLALMSNIAGGLVCEYPGVVPVNKNRLKEVMGSQKK